MVKFIITKDQKVTVWERTSYKVEAENLAEAIDKMVVFAKKDTLDAEPENGIFEYTGGIEYVIESAVPIPLAKNDGMPTLEFLNVSGETIYDNVNGHFSGSTCSETDIQKTSSFENINL